MTSAEWAAWVQSVGTVLAVVAAIWISQTQHRQALARDRRRDQDAGYRATGIAVIVFRRLSRAIADCARAFETQDAKPFRRIGYEMVDIIELARSVDLYHLPVGESAVAFMNVRAIAAEAFSYLDPAKTMQVTWSHGASIFDEMHSRLRQYGEQLETVAKAVAEA